MAWIERVPPAAYLGMALGVPILLALLGGASEAFRRGFLERYIWHPIVNDEGYNPYNTGLFVVLIAFLSLWAYRIVRHHGEHVGIEAIVGCLPFAFVGSGLRVLEDSDLFAPFGGARSCLPTSGPSWDTCLGALFVNPILFTLLAFLMVGLARLAFQATLVARRTDPLKGLRFYALTLVALVSLYSAMWAAAPSSVRLVPNPLVPLLGALIGLGVVARRMRDGSAPSWGLGTLGYSLFLAFPVLYLVLVWLLGGTADWHAARPGHPWTLGALALLPTLLTLGAVLAARRLAGPVRKEKGKPIGATRSALFLGYLVLVEAAFLFAAALAFRNIVERGDRELETFGYLLLGPLLLPIGVWLARRGADGGMGSHPRFDVFNDHMNHQLLWAQFADALMTGIAIDVYGADEKHVLPRGLIEWVGSWGLSPPLGAHPAALAMIPFKLVLVLLLIWLMDVRLGDWLRGRRDLVIIVKGAVVAAALGPALRDALRLAMGV